MEGSPGVEHRCRLLELGSQYFEAGALGVFVTGQERVALRTVASFRGS